MKSRQSLQVLRLLQFQLQVLLRELLLQLLQEQLVLLLLLASWCKQKR
jgi:hypothetical protein